MHEDKKKRLEAKGWRVGTVTDFLALSPEEEEHFELKSSQSRMAKMEAADSLKWNETPGGGSATCEPVAQEIVARFKLVAFNLGGPRLTDET